MLGFAFTIITLMLLVIWLTLCVLVSNLIKVLTIISSINAKILIVNSNFESSIKKFFQTYAN